MMVLILEQDPARRGAHAVTLIQAGFQVTSTGCIETAKRYLREETFDLLILGERVDGRVSHGVALTAEYRNPLVATILLTARTDPAVDELFLLLPSLHCLLPPDVSETLLRKCAFASVIDAASAPQPLVLLPSQRVDADRSGLLSFVSARRPANTPFAAAAYA